MEEAKKEPQQYQKGIFRRKNKGMISLHLLKFNILSPPSGCKGNFM